MQSLIFTKIISYPESCRVLHLNLLGWFCLFNDRFVTDSCRLRTAAWRKMENATKGLISRWVQPLTRDLIARSNAMICSHHFHMHYIYIYSMSFRFAQKFSKRSLQNLEESVKGQNFSYLFLDRAMEGLKPSTFIVWAARNADCAMCNQGSSSRFSLFKLSRNILMCNGESLLYSGWLWATVWGSFDHHGLANI